MGKDLQGNELGKGIIQRKNGIYELRHINKSGKRISTTAKDIKTLMEKYAMFILEEEKCVNQSPYTLNEWFCEWLNIYKSSTKEATQIIYKNIYEKFIQNVLGNKNLTSITNKDIQSLINELSDYSFETKNKIRILLLDMYSKAIANKYTNENPVKGIRIIGDKHKKEILALTQEQQRVFFDYAKGTFYYNLYVVAINTGLRVGELVCLTEKDLDFERKIIHINKGLKYSEKLNDSQKQFFISTPKTDSSYRDIPMTSLCEVALRKQLVQKQIVKRKAPITKKPKKEFEQFIFTTRFNTPLNAQVLNDDIKRMLKEINYIQNELEQLPIFSMHTFRHTFATRCFEANIPLKAVQSYLGHATFSMTSDLYTAILSDLKTEQIDKLDGLFEDIHKEDEGEKWVI